MSDTGTMNFSPQIIWVKEQNQGGVGDLACPSLKTTRDLPQSLCLDLGDEVSRDEPKQVNSLDWRSIHTLSPGLKSKLRGLASSDTM